MRKPNYRFERAERDRLKQAKKEEKAKRQQQERASDQKSTKRATPLSGRASTFPSVSRQLEDHVRVGFLRPAHGRRRFSVCPSRPKA